MSSQSASPALRIDGLDSIRFICALFVVFAHFGFLPLPEIANKSSPLSHLARGIHGNLFPGPPAVVVFFVISGFCIHFPHRNTRNIPLMPYFIRRYVRICAPLGAAMLLAWWFAPHHPSFNIRATSDTVIWSLFAEIIYYTIYPAILSGVRRFGWSFILNTAFALAFGLICIQPSLRYYLEFGPWLTWMIGLPSWILGCQLAESLGSPSACSKTKIWAWRLSVWACASISSVLMFHAQIGYPWTLPPFSCLCVLWIKREIAHAAANPGTRFLEWAGKWSYSLYLLHLVAGAVLLKWLPVMSGERPAWLIRIGLILLICYCFYLAVELPSHRLAQWLSRRPFRSLNSVGEPS